MPRQKSLLRTILEPLALAVALAFLVRSALQLYSIPSASMAPTLEAGDQIVVTPYLRGEPDRGHVIVFQSPQSGELLVKRIVAVPGDLVDSRLGRVRIGGHTLAEPYVLREAATGAIHAQLVPARSYFVLGDNRDDSLDSRSWGYVPRERVVGRARLVLWSSSPLGEIVSASASKEHGRTRNPRAGTRLFKWID
ncbi:MAG TPA: signal peptidase I [Thermoanaerobaculia bacterium]|nr:signal peptidase I [Thermoanaerobaculia bacterium]